MELDHAIFANERYALRLAEGIAWTRADTGRPNLNVIALGTPRMRDIPINTSWYDAKFEDIYLCPRFYSLQWRLGPDVSLRFPQTKIEPVGNPSGLAGFSSDLRIVELMWDY